MRSPNGILGAAAIEESVFSNANLLAPRGLSHQLGCAVLAVAERNRGSKGVPLMRG